MNYDPTQVPVRIIVTPYGRRRAVVDFAKLREQQNARIAQQRIKEANTFNHRPHLAIINDLLDSDITEWENNFLLSIKEWLKRREGNRLSTKQENKLLELAYDYQIPVKE